MSGSDPTSPIQWTCSASRSSTSSAQYEPASETGLAAEQTPANLAPRVSTNAATAPKGVSAATSGAETPGPRVAIGGVAGEGGAVGGGSAVEGSSVGTRVGELIAAAVGEAAGTSVGLPPDPPDPPGRPRRSNTSVPPARAKTAATVASERTPTRRRPGTTRRRGARRGPGAGAPEARGPRLEPTSDPPGGAASRAPQDAQNPAPGSAAIPQSWQKRVVIGDPADGSTRLVQAASAVRHFRRLRAGRTIAGA